MTLPAEDHSEIDNATKPDAGESGAEKPNFELVSEKGEAAKAEAKPAEPVKAEPVKAEASKAEASKPEAASSEPAKSEAAKPEPAKPEPAKPTQGSDSGKALATAGIGPINPFLGVAAAGAEKAETFVPPRSIGARLLDYSAHAAIIVGLIGFAWTVSDHVVSRPAKSDVPSIAAASAPPAPAPLDEMAELKLANQKMHDELRVLKANVDALRIAARRDTTPEQVRMLSAGLDAVKGTIAAAKSDTNAQISQLSGKIEKLQPGKVQALNERLGRLERQSTDSTSTGSIARNGGSRPESGRDTDRSEAKAAPKAPVKPQELASLDESHGAASEEKPTIISGWVVRDVYEGVALVEGRYGGTREVVPGSSIPGAGVVKSIDRKGGGWTVTTTKGQLAYAGMESHRDSRDYRRGPYGGRGYGPYGY